VKEALHSQGSLAWEQVIDGPRQWMGEEGQGLAWVVFLLQSGQAGLPRRMLAQE
jgi:hypothetical protein